jgi:hypothetical protein
MFLWLPRHVAWWFLIQLWIQVKMGGIDIS